jgi:NADH:ubiquinone oxidoreductase subunit B-like Fe-S oxidoreductase
MSDSNINMVALQKVLLVKVSFATKLNDVGIGSCKFIVAFAFAILLQIYGNNRITISRFGSERKVSIVREYDLLGKMAPILRQVYEQMSEPRW